MTWWAFTKAAARDAVRDYFAPVRWLWKTIRGR